VEVLQVHFATKVKNALRPLQIGAPGLALTITAMKSEDGCIVENSIAILVYPTTGIVIQPQARLSHVTSKYDRPGQKLSRFLFPVLENGFDALFNSGFPVRSNNERQIMSRL